MKRENRVRMKERSKEIKQYNGGEKNEEGNGNNLKKGLKSKMERQE